MFANLCQTKFEFLEKMPSIHICYNVTCIVVYQLVTTIKSDWNFSKGGFDLDLAEVPWQWNCQLVQALFKQGCLLNGC